MVNLSPWNRRRSESGETGSLLDLRSKVDRLFDHFFESSGFGLQPTSGMSAIWAPALEMYDEDNNLIIKAEMPGMDADDIEINVTGNELTISGEKKEESETRREGVYRSERRYGRFYRVIELPQDMDTENVSADYENGVLSLRIPYTEARQPKRISVKAGAGRKPMGGTQGGGLRGRQETGAAGQGGAAESSRSTPTARDRAGSNARAGGGTSQ